VASLHVYEVQSITITKSLLLRTPKYASLV
jgi:hypothetical protein